MSKSNNTNLSGGIGFTGLLTIVFIVLKLVGVIDWSWLWVLSPIWIDLLVVFCVFLVAFVVMAIAQIIKGIKSRRYSRWENV